jgi:hypothetical protein
MGEGFITTGKGNIGQITTLFRGRYPGANELGGKAYLKIAKGQGGRLKNSIRKRTGVALVLTVKYKGHML